MASTAPISLVGSLSTTFCLLAKTKEVYLSIIYNSSLLKHIAVMNLIGKQVIIIIYFLGELYILSTSLPSSTETGGKVYRLVDPGR